VTIPLARPWIGAAEEQALARVLASRRLVKGPECAAFEEELAAATGRRHVVAVSSGTTALFLALQACDIGPGSRVAVPALTFPATANAPLALGAQVVLCDIQERSWNIDPRALEALGRCDAVIPVDQFGFPADWDGVAAVASAWNSVVVEDAACALGATRGGRAPGSMARAAILSFHPRKVITTGEGGAVLTDDDHIAARCRQLRDHGVDAGGRFSEPALNFRMSELAAAVGRAQLTRLEEAADLRTALAFRYREKLAGLGLGFQGDDSDAVHALQTFAVLLPDSAPPRDDVVARLRAGGVESTIASYALQRLEHVAGVASEAGAGADLPMACPVAARIADRALALPLFAEMSPQQVDTVATTLRAILGGSPGRES